MNKIMIGCHMLHVASGLANNGPANLQGRANTGGIAPTDMAVNQWGDSNGKDVVGFLAGNPEVADVWPLHKQAVRQTSVKEWGEDEDEDKEVEEEEDDFQVVWEWQVCK